MKHRLEVESVELAELFREAGEIKQRDVTEAMVQRAVDEQIPTLVLPGDLDELAALVSQLDEYENDAGFRRARAASAHEFLLGGMYDALYEALHARSAPRNAVREAVALLR